MKIPSISPKIPIYINNGQGRDTYISFYNGGFGYYKYSKSYKKDIYEIPIKKRHPDLFKRRPIDRYQISGEGREYFIYKGIESEHERVSENNSFEKILRKGDSPGEMRVSRKRPRNKFEKILINRIFYGNCPGVKDRDMSPKVKFKKDIDKEKEEEEISKDNFSKREENNCNRYLNTMNSFLKTNKNNSIANSYKKIDLMGTLNFRRIKKNDRKDNDINRSQHIINSVKKIFLYNNKSRMNTEHY